MAGARRAVGVDPDQSPPQGQEAGGVEVGVAGADHGVCEQAGGRLEVTGVEQLGVPVDDVGDRDLVRG